MIQKIFSCVEVQVYGRALKPPIGQVALPQPPEQGSDRKSRFKTTASMAKVVKLRNEPIGELDKNKTPHPGFTTTRQGCMIRSLADLYQRIPLSRILLIRSPLTGTATCSTIR